MPCYELRLNDLFACAGTDLDHAFVIFFALLRNPQNMLARRNVSQDNAA